MAAAFTLLCLAAGLLFAGLAMLSLHGLLRMRDLPGRMPEDRPGVAVIVPARNERQRIDGTLLRLRRQHGVELEIVVVDDRSADGTGEIVAAHAADDPRVRQLRIDDLPDGWLGKCHALQLGVDHSRAGWLLFVDADSWLEPDVVARSVAAAVAADVGHVTLMPRVAGTRGLARTAILAMSLALLRQQAAVNGDAARSYLALGAFNLVRRDLYARAGGHRALRLEVLDDLRLGRALRRAGGRTRAYFAAGVEVQWITDLASLFRLLRKNYFAVVDFAYGRGAAVAGVLAGAWLGAVSGAVFGGPAGIGAAAALAATSIPAAGFARRYRWPIWWALGVPLVGLPLQVAAFVGSMIAVARAGGVRWRDTFYPTAVLKRGAGAGCRETLSAAAPPARGRAPRG